MSKQTLNQCLWEYMRCQSIDRLKRRRVQCRLKLVLVVVVVYALQSTHMSATYARLFLLFLLFCFDVSCLPTFSRGRERQKKHSHRANAMLETQAYNGYLSLLLSFFNNTAEKKASSSMANIEILEAILFIRLSQSFSFFAIPISFLPSTPDKSSTVQLFADENDSIC